MNVFLIIDGMNLVRRMHAALPNENNIDGLQEQVHRSCKKLIRFHQPTHVTIVWDGKAISWRKRLFEDYKKGRKPMPEALDNGLASLKSYLENQHIHSIDALSEADDVIATLATKLVQVNGKAIIVSTDKGFNQLIHPHIQLWDHFNQSFLTTESREEKLGVERGQFLDYLALAGDSGNKIPGVPGIGPKSASELLKTFRTLGNIYRSLDQIGTKQAQKLATGKTLAKLSYKLIQLQTNLPLNVNLKQFRLPSETTRLD
ncbi:flap endonuclease Xni [uncultured Shewanella sp.]|uniref:flap endonuclease Xni n=1 Tax=uncultured Shewanella sp. TaxID=173975 RepID=UPI00262EC6F9|nr:flap endonuclease Xni [uncultured Shewanella sp.]